ncbi:MAG: BCD family MFS transporter [Anaerolineaceae bacterium]|nr:BCD family MFS transporter [Anaerolineaceae bacterium]
MFLKRVQLSLIHLAVAMTLVPINSTLNRVMIKEMAISATLVSILASLPYLFSPTQVLIGSYADRHPVFGWRRTPYIAAGLLLCVAGVTLAPQVVFLMPQNWWLGLGLSVLTFGAWGMGFNLASVSYLSLASEISGERGRTRTVSIMWFVMILGIIFTAASLSHLMEPYSPQTLRYAFEIVGLVSLALGLLGLFRLEPRQTTPAQSAPAQARDSWPTLLRVVLSNPQARRFFVYMIVLLAAILGQDVLLEPYAGEAFHLPVEATTRITSIWGTCVLITLLAAGFLEKRFSKRRIVQVSAWVALVGFLIIAFSGFIGQKNVFYAGVMVLGLGTGLSTASNLSLMLDMTTSRVGLFIGAWGMADALARLVGTVTSGAVRDLITQFSQSAIAGYVVVFLLQAGMLLVSWFLLRGLDVERFQQESPPLGVVERSAMINET